MSLVALVLVLLMLVDEGIIFVEVLYECKDLCLCDMVGGGGIFMIVGDDYSGVDAHRREHPGDGFFSSEKMLVTPNSFVVRAVVLMESSVETSTGWILFGDAKKM
jgi:hypothetical protein